MARKMSREAYLFVVKTIQENGSMSTDEVVELVRPFYDHDPKAARERELRRYVGQLVRGHRDALGVRTMFLEKVHSEIVDLDNCKDAEKVSLVGEQLMLQAKGLWKSCKKARKRKFALSGQTSMFDEAALLRELSS